MWSIICIEGYCFAAVEQPSEKRPCGRTAVSVFCLLNGICPYFAFSDSSERKAAVFAPLWAILWGKIKHGAEESYLKLRKLRWYCWDKWFNRPLKIETVKSLTPAWDEQLKQAKANFPEWFRKTGGYDHE